jgi:hypothetical protein
MILIKEYKKTKTTRKLSKQINNNKLKIKKQRKQAKYKKAKEYQ